MKVGEYIGQLLVKLGIRYYFAIPGDYNLALLDILHKNKDIKPIYCANELNMSYSADGYSRLAELAVFITTFSVGGLSACNGVAGAFAEDLPVLHISLGPHTDDKVEFHTMHHTTGLPDTTYVERMFKDITIYSKRIDNVDNVVKHFEQAFTLMRRYKKPAYLELPMNLPNEKLPILSVPNIPLTLCKSLNNRPLIDKIASLVNKAKSPVLVVGTRMRYYQKELNRFIQMKKFATCCLPNAKGIVSSGNPAYIGIYWETTSSPFVEETVNKSDFVIYVGCLFNDYNSSGYTHKKDEKTTLYLGTETLKYRHVVYETGDLKSVLKYLGKKIKRNPSVLRRFKSHKIPAEVMPKIDNKKLTLESMRKVAQSYVTNKTTVIVETGTSWLLGIFMKLAPKTIFEIQMQYGSIGWSLGAAFGAHLANPKNTLMLFIGDGSLQMTVQNIGSMIRYRMKGIIFLVNNKGYVIEDSIHKGPYNDINNWNYSQLMPVFDPDGRYSMNFEVETIKEFDTAIKSSINSGKLCFVNCHISRTDVQKKLITWGKNVGKYNKRKTKFYRP